MTRPPHRSNPTRTQGPQQKRSRARRATRMTVGVTLILAVGTGIAVGAAAYTRNVASDSAAVAPTATQAAPEEEVRDTDVARDDAEARDLAEMGQSREVIPGLAVEIGDIRVSTDPSGLRATTLPLEVVNTGDLTRSFDITIVAISDKGEVITTDVGTAANLRPGQSAQVQVLEIVGDELAEELAEASFRIDEAYAY